MKKLLLIILLLPFLANAQINGVIQKTSATSIIRGSFGSIGIDTLVSITGTLTNGYILKYNSTTKKWYGVADPTYAGLQDSLTKKANRTFDNVASNAIAIAKVNGLQTALDGKESALTFSTGLTRSINTITVNQAFTPTWTGMHTWTASNNRFEGSAAANAFSVIVRNTETTGFSTHRLYNDINSGTRALQLDYSGSTSTSPIITNGVAAEKGVIHTTGAYPIEFGTNNVLAMTINGSTQVVSFANTIVGSITGNAGTANTATNVTGIVAIANGGTGSSTQNFVDLITNQTVSTGIKSFMKSVNLGSTSTPNGSILYGAASTAGTGTISVTAAGTTVTGAGTVFFSEFIIGDLITSNGENRRITAIASNTSMTTAAWTSTFSGSFTLKGGGRFIAQRNGNVSIGNVDTVNTEGAPLNQFTIPLNISRTAIDPGQMIGVRTSMFASRITAHSDQPLFGGAFASRISGNNTKNWTSTGTVNLAGNLSIAQIDPGANGIMSSAAGIETYLLNDASGFTITDAYGIKIKTVDGTTVGNITNSAGIAINVGNNATNKTQLLLGTNTIPSGNYGIYSVSTNPSSLAGSLTAASLIKSGGTSAQYLMADGSVTTGGGGVTTMAAIGAVPNANGASISGSTLTLQPASSGFGGVLTTGAQTIAGVKTLSSDAIINGLTVGRGGGNISTNTALGNLSLNSNTVGDYNTSIGASSGQLTTGGYSNTGVGALALYSNLTGFMSVAVGRNALGNQTSANRNIAIGDQTGLGITTGSGNTIIGSSVSGLAAGLTNNIILSSGVGAIKAQHDGTNWTLTGGTTITGALTGTSAAFNGPLNLSNNINADLTASITNNSFTAAARSRLDFNAGADFTTLIQYSSAHGSAPGQFVIYNSSSTGAIVFSTAGTERLRIANTGTSIFAAPIRLKGYTVATLPAGTQGDVAFVTDALAPTFMSIIVGGGSIISKVFYNGSNWTSQ